MVELDIKVVEESGTRRVDAVDRATGAAVGTFGNVEGLNHRMTATLMGYHVEEVVSLVEELLAKSWTVGKARTAKLIEVLCPDRRNEWKNGLNNETLDLLSILLDDMSDAAREVLRQRAPEITTEMLRAAQEERLRENVALTRRQLVNKADRLEMELEQVRNTIASMEQQGRATGSIGLPVPKGSGD